MTILQRIRNLWRLSALVITDSEYKEIIEVSTKHLQEKSKAAKIVEMADPIKELDLE